MRVEKLVVGQLGTNCYLVWDEKSGKTIIIDPGDAADFIIRKTQDLKLFPILIIATHGHFDHVLAVTELKLAFKIPLLMHRADLFLLKRAPGTAKFFMGFEVDPSLPVDRFVKEGDIIWFGNEKLKILETPGHTPGGISLVGKGILFSGDTIFADGFGRTDFNYGSKKDLEKSIKKLFKLPGDTLVYPGHGEETTIGEAKNLR